MNHEQIARCFNRCFEQSERTILIGGAAEPLYQPADHGKPARLCYREDFAASALHETAHWCIAGRRRRQLVDFGYRYVAPPRDAAAQEHFFALEVRTQALESLFAEAAGLVFRVSADNLDVDPKPFGERVRSFRPSARQWLATPAGHRARLFVNALRKLTAHSELADG